MAERVITKVVSEAYAYCEQFTRAHYENFPVASVFLPREKRRYVASIYAFARTADDFADEGDVGVQQRLQSLDDWEAQLEDCFVGRATHPIYVALAETVARFDIPKKPLADLLAAFRLDVTKKRFATFDELHHYCTLSAAPIGRLVLCIFQSAGERTNLLSDAVCTGLQLANFWQDVSVDWAKGRLYIPVEDCGRFGYTESDLCNRLVDDRFRGLMEFQVQRTAAFFERGKNICQEVVPELQFELRLTWHGGMTILRKIEAIGYDVLHHRPKLSIRDSLGVFSRAILFGIS